MHISIEFISQKSNNYIQRMEGLRYTNVYFVSQYNIQGQCFVLSK